VNSLQAKIPTGQVTFNVNNHVRISKQKVLFAKGYEQSYSTEIFRVANVIQRRPQPVYQLTDLQGRPIEGQFYYYELVKVSVTPDTDFQIDKILRIRNKNGIIQHFVKWKGYDETFNSWVNAGDIKDL
jgi:xanthine dehydrogenase molybdopterin-binding subunit B